MSLKREFNPLVSIIIPVYNGSNYMKEAIDSALAQTYENIEIIVVNDGSADGGKTEEIALSYGDKIRYFKKENGGVSSALNLGIEKMQGEYFSWLSHDDKYAPEKIEEQVKLLNGAENTVVLCGDGKINKDSEFIGKSANNRFAENSVINSKVVLKSILEKGSFNGCALLIPKTAFEKSGKFDETLRYVQDVLMWIKIFINGFSVIYSSKPLCYCRVHNGQLTQTGRQLFYEESIIMVENIAEDLVKASDKQYNFLYFLAKHNAVIGNKSVVKYALDLDKKFKVLDAIQKLNIRVCSFYGNFRPFIRKIYYKLFLKVKTQ